MQLWWTDSYRKQDLPHGLRTETNLVFPNEVYEPKKYEALRKKAEEKYGPVEQWDVGRLRSLPRFCEYHILAAWKQIYLPSFRISHWRTRGIESMRRVFFDCKGFNQPLNWDTSTVRDMTEMFEHCSDFNDSSISSWNVSKVRLMTCMFCNATSFNQNLGSWNLFSPAHLVDVRLMFSDAAAFDQNLYAWGWGPGLANSLGGLRTSPCMIANTIVSRRLRIAGNDLHPGKMSFRRSWMDEDRWRRAFALPSDRVQGRIP
ncbi:unnamed protein product [Amoebophrya sp. A120]|nr:unnamed protein product [Amoebophrya sp. A120]|eukprot:GSA120T00023157001.1